MPVNVFAYKLSTTSTDDFYLCLKKLNIYLNIQNDGPHAQLCKI